MAFRNGQTEDQIQALTTAARVTENDFRNGLNSVIEKADNAPRSLTVNGELATSDANDNWSVTIEAEDGRLPAAPDTGVAQELIFDGSEFVWRTRTPAVVPVLMHNNQPLWTVGEPVRREGIVTPRVIPTPTFSASGVGQGGSQFGGRTVGSTSGQAVAFALSAEAQTFPTFEPYWSRGVVAPTAGSNWRATAQFSVGRGNAGYLLAAATSAPLNDLVQALSGGEVSGSISSTGSSRVSVSLNGLTSSFVSSYPIIVCYFRGTGYASGSNSAGVLINLTDYSAVAGGGQNSSFNDVHDFAGLRQSTRLSGGNPGTIVNDASVPAVQVPLTLNVAAFQDALGITP